MQVVGKKTLNKVLDVIHQNCGVSGQEIADTLDMSYSSISYAIRYLMIYNCISKGVAKTLTKTGKESLRPAFYYESDITIN